MCLRYSNRDNRARRQHAARAYLTYRKSLARYYWHREMRTSHVMLRGRPKAIVIDRNLFRHCPGRMS